MFSRRLIERRRNADCQTAQKPTQIHVTLSALQFNRVELFTMSTTEKQSNSPAPKHSKTKNGQENVLNDVDL